jgi:hypothetical protein
VFIFRFEKFQKSGCLSNENLRGILKAANRLLPAHWEPYDFVGKLPIAVSAGTGRFRSMTALDDLLSRVSHAFGNQSPEYAEAQAVRQAVGSKISSARAVVFLSDILSHGTLWREVYSGQEGSQGLLR